MQLNNKVALITSSRKGVCADTAMQLAVAGARVMICGRNATEGRATVAQIQRAGGRAGFILADIALPADVQAAIDETIATYGRLDILFNSVNAQYAQDGALLEVSESTWDRVNENTLKGTFLCCQYAIPFLRNSGRNEGRGVIINLIEPSAVDEAYTVTQVCQGGILAMTCAIAQQFSAQHLSANVIWSMQSPDFPLNGLITEKVLYGPANQPSAASSTDEGSSDPPFTAISEAVQYLVTEGDRLHGYVLMVSSE